MLQILNPFKAGQEFQKLKSKKKWIFALVFVFVPVVLSTVGNNLVQQKNQEFIQQNMEEFTAPEGTPPEGRDAPRRQPGIPLLGPVNRMFQVGTSGGMGTANITLALALGLALAAVYWVLKSVVFHLGSKILGGEKAIISSTIHLIAYTYIPFVFKGILDIIEGVLYEVPTSMQEFSQLRTDMFLNYVSNYFNIFVLWALFLMIIAVREQYTLSNKKAALIVLISYIVAWILQIVILPSVNLFGGII
jgi:hypothetical protein